MLNKLFLSLFVIISLFYAQPLISSTRPNCPLDISAFDPQRQDCLKEWSVFIYMAADNDLTPYALWDIYEMERVLKGAKNLGSTSYNIDVVVELDTFGPKGINRYLIEQGKEIYDPQINLDFLKKADESLITSSPLKHFSEDIPSTQQTRFRHFLNDGLHDFPSKKVMLVIWGHGEGFIGKQIYTKNLNKVLVLDQEEEDQIEYHSPYLNPEMLELKSLDFAKLPSHFPVNKSFGGVAFDYSDLTYLDIPSLANIIKEARENHLDGRKIDLLAFDACLMQSYEVAMTLKSEIEFLTGSVQIQNYLGLPYRYILDELNDKSPGQKNKTPYQLAKIIPNLVEKSFQKNAYQGKMVLKEAQTFTVSSLSLHEMYHQLYPALLNLKNTLNIYIKEKPLREMELLLILSKSPTFRGENRDLGIFLGVLKKLLYQEKLIDGYESKEMFNLNQALDRSYSALEKSMMAYSFGELYINPELSFANENNQYLLGYFKGLSFWLPAKKDLYLNRKKEYQNFPLLFLPSIWH